MDKSSYPAVLLSVYLIYTISCVSPSQVTSPAFSQTLQGLAVVDHHVYVGATNTIYTLNSSTLAEQQSRPLNQESTTLIGVYDSYKILVCTSKQGQCELLSTSDLTTLVSSSSTNPPWHLTQRSDGRVVFVKAGFRKTDGQLRDSLYLTSSFSGLDSIATTVRSPTDFTFADMIPGSFSDPDPVGSELRYAKDGISETDPSITTLQYLYAFAAHDWTFYVKNVEGKAYIGGSCNSDIVYNTLVELPLICNGGGMEKTFLQGVTSGKAGQRLVVTLNKQDSSIDDNNVLLYGVFGTGSSSSPTSLCVFNVESLIGKMERAFESCHLTGAGLNDITIGPKFITADDRITNCSKLANGENEFGELKSCEIVGQAAWSRATSYSPLVDSNTADTISSSAMELNFSIIDVLVIHAGQETIGVMTSSDGKIRKVTINNGGMGRSGVYRIHTLADMTSGTALLPYTAADTSRIYALSSDKVFSVPVQECDTVSTCGECSELADPHCGWCSLSNKCTVSSACAESDSDGYWLQGKAPSGCITPDLDSTKFSVEHSDNDRPIQLRIELNIVPTASTTAYKCCLFEDTGSEICNTATVKEESTISVIKEYMICNTSSKSVLAARIAEGSDNVATNLDLKVGDATFASLELTFYDCSRHTNCSSCATTEVSFSCLWCVSSFSCINKDQLTSCSGGAIESKDVIIPTSGASKGVEYCPKFNQTQPDISNLMLVPSGTNPSLEFNIWNQNQGIKYFCIVSWDGEVQRNLSANLVAIPSTGFDGATQVECEVMEPFFFTGPDTSKQASIALQVGGRDQYLDNENNIHLELYKCEVLSTTCGECLNPSNSRYKCGWCQSLSSNCDVRELCPDTATFLTSDHNSCPFLEITNIEPIDGPALGQTKLTITGVNLGSAYSEIKDWVYIKLAGGERVSCVPDETSYSTHGFTCTTTATSVSSGPVVVSINGETSKIAESKQTYSFYAPNVTNLSSTRGPQSGGIEISLLGQNINIGSQQNVTMKLDNSSVIPCVITSRSREPDRIDLNEIRFIIPEISPPQNVSIVLSVDGYFYPPGGLSNNNTRFSYLNDPTVIGIRPNRTIMAGGTHVRVSGTDLDLVANPKMYIRLVSSLTRKRRFSRSIGQNVTVPCMDSTTTEMVCVMPPVPKEWIGGDIQYGFIMNNVKGVKDLSGKNGLPTFSVTVNPNFTKFKDAQQTTSESTLRIQGTNLLVLGSDEVVKPMLTVNLTLEDDRQGGRERLSCTVTHVQSDQLYCDLPVLESSQKYKVSVGYGELLTEDVGIVSTVNEANIPQEAYIAIGVGCGVFIIVVVIVIIVLRCRVTKTNQGMKKLQDKMDNLEMTVAKECKEAFTELQTDMTEMTADIAALHGLPFFEYNSYCMKVLFPTQNENDHPVMRRLEVPGGKEQVERGLHQFSRLVYNKTFLLTFIRTLEQQKNFAIKDRVEVASLVSVALQPKMEYHTDILKTLVAELIERTVETKKDARILMRRNESVAEKMLSNWFAFLLQKFLKECAGEPLYLLFRAIKQQVDKGPVDAVTADAKYSLSEDKLLRQTVDFYPITLKFRSPDEHAAQDPQTVKALSCDTISQAIDKILDTVYRNVPYSNTGRPLKGQLILEWVRPNGERIPMHDEDPTFSKIESDNCKRMATLACYKIPDNSMVALIPKQQFNDTKSSLPRHGTLKKSLSHKIYEYMMTNRSWSSSTEDMMSVYTNGSNGNYYGSTGDSLSRANSLNNILGDTSTGARPEKRVHRYHLVKPSEADTHQEGDRNKMVSEIYLTRLLATKGTLQQFVDDLFETIFSTAHRGSALPLAIKYMFDFLDDQALLHSISNPDVIHHWKSNSLPLRFWVNVIKNPDFVFDIHKSNIVDACLSVVAQIFMDSCSLSEHRLGKESPSSKLLYAKDIPKYRKWVERYYSDIKSMPAISDSDMNATLAEESRQHRNEFNNSAAMFELYQYVLQYSPEVLSALREDEFARKDQLAEDLVYVNQMLNLSSFTRG